MTRPPTSATRDPRPGNRIGLRLEISRDDRDRLLLLAARQQISMSSLLRRVVAAYIEAEERKAK